jgi:hypothetical protein
MGNTLSGLTPSQTFQGLIKVGNNTNVDGTAKVLSDGAGTDLPMEVSTAGVNLTGSPTVNSVAIANTNEVAAKQDTLVSGTNIKTINGATVLGSGDVAVQETLVSGTNIKTINGTSVLGSGDIVTPSTPPSGAAGAIQFTDGSAFASDAANLFWDDTNNRLGVGTNAPTATTHIKGSGTTSATTALLVQNSAGVASLQVLDDTSVFNNGKGAVADNTAFGNRALINNTSGNLNTAVGFEALQNNTSGSFNTANGVRALRNNTSGTFNTANGVNALAVNTTANDNTANGVNALSQNTTGSNNTAIGRSALQNNTTGTNNTAIGRSALLNNTASNNTAVGFEAALTNTSGTGITAIGYQALRANTTGTGNTAVGDSSGLAITTGFRNTSVGFQSLGASNTSENTAIGFQTLANNINGNNNVCVGSLAGSSNTIGGSNIVIGRNSQTGNFNGSIIMGMSATATADNQFVVGSATTNAGAVTTEVIVPDTTWTVRINGANYKIAMLAI